MNPTLAELGEADLLRRLARFAPPGQLDDDTACLSSDPRPILINTDVLVDGVHFSDATTSAEDVGWRAVATNLSDLAASGAIAVDGITVALVAPGNTCMSWVEGVYDGIAAALGRYGGSLLGGDCSNGGQRLISVTAIGRLGPLRLHRNAARAGDVLVTSGPHGLSKLGLTLLQDERQLSSTHLSDQLKAAAIQQHRRPVPRFDALQALLNCKPSHSPWRAGGTDSSDGLIAAVEGLCCSSGCGAELDRQRLPRASQWPLGDLWDGWCMDGGEDFELVLSLPPDWAEAWLNTLPGSECFGRITADPGQLIWRDDQSAVEPSGFDHYAKF